MDCPLFELWLLEVGMPEGRAGQWWNPRAEGGRTKSLTMETFQGRWATGRSTIPAWRGTHHILVNELKQCS